MLEFVTFCTTVAIIIGGTTIGAVAGVLLYFALKSTGHGSALHPHPGDPKRRVSH